MIAKLCFPTLPACFFAFTHPIILGIDQPTIVLTIIPYNGIQYSAGIAGGECLKLAVKLPYLSTTKFADASFGLILKSLRNEFRGESEIEDVLKAMVKL